MNPEREQGAPPQLLLGAERMFAGAPDKYLAAIRRGLFMLFFGIIVAVLSMPVVVLLVHAAPLVSILTALLCLPVIFVLLFGGWFFISTKDKSSFSEPRLSQIGLRLSLLAYLALLPITVYYTSTDPDGITTENLKLATKVVSFFITGAGFTILLHLGSRSNRYKTLRLNMIMAKLFRFGVMFGIATYGSILLGITVITVPVALIAVTLFTITFVLSMILQIKIAREIGEIRKITRRVVKEARTQGSAI